MSQYLSDVIEEDVIKCNVCKKDFIVEELTTDDWNFAWDNYVTKDCCSSCSSKIRKEKK
jgi:hypothetical protein